jgi:hypothetical protein
MCVVGLHPTPQHPPPTLSLQDLLTNMEDFLSILNGSGMRAGFVFFDDCWQHSGAVLGVCLNDRS